MNVNRNHPNLGPRLTFVDKYGKRIARLGGEHGPGQEVGKFLAPHGVCMDSRGDIYVGEVSYTNYLNINPGKSAPEYLRSLQKLERVT
jgi:hypothetical protein